MFRYKNIPWLYVDMQNQPIYHEILPSSLSYLDHGNTEEEAYTNGSVNSYSLSLDLMIEIFKQLPLKNLIRSLCVSKQWASIICGRYFMKLFLNESLTRPKSVVFVFRKRLHMN
ncbi:hypothetical protein YC2023_042349 [Brassica napus]